ncbi:Eukaryotic translation initiation factor 4 gamma 1 [Bagarius yarrelli]|uniref:Eukaryotic translation initiation factor 4 gamma 1 n=1 Tax=Bagarius yarrelli TaxID=175774 RepID=A0A556TTS1_BAGYA|nr:Eukaryotic translation initiation factor 4 gamma 1 [Bagarius yarrelli]
MIRGSRISQYVTELDLDVDPDEMNKVPGPPSSSPIPAPSPNLPQPNFSPTPPPSMVFATPTPPPMNPTAPTRQPFYPVRPTLPANPTRAQASSAPRAIPGPHGTHAPHVFQPGSQMMMIPTQPISFPNSQGPAYYIPSQEQSAGAYYPAQPQFTPPVATPPVLMNPAPQQQQAPPPPQHPAPAKRERKQIRIRDPNQGGKDITEEIMSGGRSASTPTPPQSALPASEGEVMAQANGEMATRPVIAARRDEPVKPVVSVEFPVPPGESPIPDAPPTPPPTSPIIDIVDAPLPTMDKAMQLEEELKPSLAAVLSNANGSTVNVAEPAAASVPLSVTGAEPPLESPIAQPEELQFVNGLTADANKDVSPLAEPDITKEAPPIVEECSTRTTKAEHPVVKETSTQVVAETPPLPTVSESSVPSVKETSAPKQIPAPVVTKSTSEVAKDTPSTAEKESTAPVAKETLLPVVLETPSPVARETSNPVVKETVEEPCPVVKETLEQIVKESPEAPVFAAAKAMPASPPPASVEEREDTPPPQTTAPDSTMQAVSVPKKKRKLKDLNKKETGDVLDAFKEPPPPKPEATPPVKSEEADPAPVAPPPAEEVEETWEEKEDKLDAENVQPQSPAPATPTEQKYQYKEGVNKTPLRPLDLSRMNCGPDFTPSFANLGRQPVGGRGPAVSLPGPRRSGQSGSRKEPRKIVLSGVSLTDDIQLNKAENAWRRGAAAESEDAESVKTRELLRRVRGVLNKLTPQMFQPLMKQITEMTIDTEERLKGVIDLVFEKAISEPNFSVAYANMCRCLMGPRMDQYFNQMEKIIKDRKTSSRIRFMLQDVIDLRRNNWVPRRGDQGPKTIEQIHKDAEMEEQREQIKVQQQLLSKKDTRGVGGGGGGGVTLGPRGVGSAPHRGNPPPDDGWNTVPISTKNRPIDTTRLSKITKPGALDFNNQLLAPGGKGSWGSWGKGSSGGSGAKPSESAASFLHLIFLHLTSSSSIMDTDRRVPQRSSSSRERGDRLERGPDRNRAGISKRSFSREKDEREQRPSETVRRVASMTDERERLRERERQRAPSKDNIRREPVSTPPPAPSKPALSLEDLEKKSTAIIEEYLHINDMKEALQCVSEMNSASLLYVFVRTGIESTLERSTIAREHMGLLLHQLVKAGMLLMEVLEVAEDMAIDVPHIWVYLAELISPLLHEGGIPMGSLFREAGLSWKDFLSEGEDVTEFVKEKQQASSDAFVRALMTSVCQAAIICETPYKVDSKEISQRAKLLQRYIKDEQKELQALYALQSLMVQMEQPPNLLRMFFDVLYDEDIIKEDGFYKWESSKDPAEQQGKGVALKSVTAFFTWLREAEDESDNS